MDLIKSMEEDSGLKLSTLRVDGGATANNFLMQFQSDILGADVQRPEVTETTALGAAYLAGLAVGFWNSKEEIAKNWAIERTFTANMTTDAREKKSSDWVKAVGRAQAWEEQ
jgi:glycerol kinase